jgi:hypothetical protein
MQQRHGALVQLHDMSTHINRRSFLTSTAVATAGALVAPAIAAEAATPAAKEPATAAASQPARKLRLGMIGLGGQGTWHLGVVKDIPNAAIVALCDVDTRNVVRAARVATSAEVYVDFRDLLKHKDLDAVLIATPRPYARRDLRRRDAGGEACLLREAAHAHDSRAARHCRHF